MKYFKDELRKATIHEGVQRQYLNEQSLLF